MYDQHNGSYAARLWWMLRALGHEHAALLDGGWLAWLRAGGAEDAPPDADESCAASFWSCSAVGILSVFSQRGHLPRLPAIAIETLTLWPRGRFAG